MPSSPPLRIPRDIARALAALPPAERRRAFENYLAERELWAPLATAQTPERRAQERIATLAPRAIEVLIETIDELIADPATLTPALMTELARIGVRHFGWTPSSELLDALEARAVVA